MFLPYFFYIIRAQGAIYSFYGVLNPYLCRSRMNIAYVRILQQRYLEPVSCSHRLDSLFGIDKSTGQ